MDTDTVIIQVCDHEDHSGYARWSKNRSDKSERFVVDCFNCPVSETIFSQIAVAPVRLDLRGD